MDQKKGFAEPAFEAILFSSGEPVPSKRAAEALGITSAELENVANEIIKKFNNENSGIKIVKIGNKYQMCTKNKYMEQVQKFMNIKNDSPLSSAATEVLAIIAYKQPVTRAFIESVRGTDCREIVMGLVRKSLIEEKGRLGIPGNPIIYGTTDKFLRCMGIASIENLPPIPQHLTEKVETSEKA